MTPPAPTARLRHARIAVSSVFFVHGFVFSSWAARVPAVRTDLHLTAGVLGLVMAGPGLGALVGSQGGGLLVNRIGSRAASALAPLLLCGPLALIPAAHSAWPLFLLLLLLGAGDGATSVAMSAQSVAVQDAYGRPVINSMHAVRSLGAVAGSLAGAATVAWGLTSQFVTAAVVAAVLSGAAAAGLLPDRPEKAAAAGPAGERPRSTIRRTVLLLAAMAFFASLVEDAPASWGGVYLKAIGAGPAAAASAYAALSAGEVLGRLTNDRIVARSGWTRLIRTGTLASAAALVLALALGRPTVMLAALVVAGVGISAVFPGAYATAGTLPGSATAMAQVGFAGNAGWLLVSPIMGALATGLSLRAAFALLPVAAVVIAALTGVTRRAGRSTASAQDDALPRAPEAADRGAHPQT